MIKMTELDESKVYVNQDKIIFMRTEFTEFRVPYTIIYFDTCSISVRESIEDIEFLIYRKRAQSRG